VSTTHDERSLGKTIRIYLADGSPTGIRHAELVNWTIQVVVCPRGRVPALSKWPESQRPGAYILVGEDGNGPLAYIGETENVWKRLQHHVAKKDFWQQVVFVTSKDDNLTKAHVKYIESRFLDLAEQAKRIPLEKGRASERPNLPKPDRDAMEEYIGSARILLSALGFPYLEMPTQGTVVKSDPATAETAEGGLTGLTLSFSVRKTGVQATGAVTDEGFVVFKGALGSATISDSLPPGWTAIRERGLQTGAIRMTEAGALFQKDVLFSSPSAASAVLSGTTRNGRRDWKARDGRSLKELEEAQAEAGSESPDAAVDEDEEEAADA
jgi:hypothetical protein